METKNTGGPAFPGIGYREIDTHHPMTGEKVGTTEVEVKEPGMSLRDYFAARAMQGIICTQPYPDGIVTVGIAGDAYAIADAMIKAREQ
jgi:hypothetical protein